MRSAGRVGFVVALMSAALVAGTTPASADVESGHRVSHRPDGWHRNDPTFVPLPIDPSGWSAPASLQRK